MYVLLFMIALIGADTKSEKPLSPREKREADIKAIHEKLAPHEKKWREKNEEIAWAKAAPVTGRDEGRLTGFAQQQITGFRTLEDKKKQIAKFQSEADAIFEKVKPLRDELAALKKKPLSPPPDKTPDPK